MRCGRIATSRPRRKFATIYRTRRLFGEEAHAKAELRGDVAELAYAADLKSAGLGLVGSSPTVPTILPAALAA